MKKTILGALTWLKMRRGMWGRLVLVSFASQIGATACVTQRDMMVLRADRVKREQRAKECKMNLTSDLLKAMPASKSRDSYFKELVQWTSEVCDRDL